MYVYLIFLNFAKLATRMIASIDTATNSIGDNMDFGVRKSE